METRLIACIVCFFVATNADFQCVCNSNVDMAVFSAMSEQASQLGSMYQYNCKAIVSGVAVNQNWAVVAFEHQVGYVKLNDGAKPQLCPGDPPTDDLVPTMSTTMAPDSSAKITAASTGLPISTVTSLPVSKLTSQPTYTFTASKPLSTVTVATTTSSATAPPTSAATAPNTSASTAPPTSAATAPPSSAASALPSSTSTMAPSSMTSAAVATVTSPLASTFTTTPPSTTKTPTYPNTAGLASTTEHTVSTTAASGATMTYVGSSTTASAASCPTSFSLTTTFQQSCYEFVLHHSTWTSAEADCRHKGGHLMHITSAVEQDFIAKYLLAHFNHEVWIGLNDRTMEEQFEWTSGAPLTYTHWDPDRKDFLFHGTENCVVMQPILKGTWDDRQCSGFLAATHSYVCQYSVLDPGSVIIG